MSFDWRGRADLSPAFIPFVAVFAITFGEVIPGCSQAGGCFAVAPPGAKQAPFVDGMIVAIAGIYLVLGTVFWFLYRRLHWLIVALIAAVLGEAMEFLLFRPQETKGINVVDDPVGAFWFLLIVWPALLVSPYLLFVGLHRLRRILAGR